MIYLAPYDPSWPLLFQQEQTILLGAIGQWVEAIEHIGSTAIPGIKAKPVIDLMIGVKSLEVFDRHGIDKIVKLGYDYINKYESMMPDRRYFQKIDQKGNHSHHIHLVCINSDFWTRHLLFRDYLRAHPCEAQNYEQLKIKLAQQFTDSNEYAGAKSDFVTNIEKKAKIEKGA